MPDAIREPGVRASRVALGGLLLAAAGHYAWNAAAQPGFWGYDEGAHAGYVLSILEEHALPHPLSGWVTFHPPLFYLLGAVTWGALEPRRPELILPALRSFSALGILAAGAVVYTLARRLAASPATSWTAAALVLFVPVAQLSASMLGNEALAAGFAALALAAILALQCDPRRVGSGALAGLFGGLAAATKFSGVWVLLVAALPFLRRDLDGRGRQALAACAGLALLVAGPVYARNAVLMGTPFPFTRSTHEVMQRQEARLTVRERRISDYVRVPASCGRYPYVTVVVEGGVWAGLNPAMQSVPCLAYAGVWFDPFGLRATRRDPREGLRIGTLLLYAGIVPSIVTLLGLGHATARVLRSRGRAPETPLLALAALGTGSFAAFTWLVPSLVAAKASYLLPLLVPAGVFFAQGCGVLGRRVRAAVLALSLGAAALAAYAFTTGTLFAPTDAAASRGFWMAMGRELPASHIADAAARLVE